MSPPSRLRRAPLRTLLLVALLLASARIAVPAEVGAFISGGSPGEIWGTGYGGTLTITLFNLVGGEIEGSWQGSDLPSTSLLTLSAKAYIGPSFGRFVPYGGLGAGVYRESLAGISDTGTLGLVFVGARFKFPVGLVLRGEYQWVDLPAAAPLDMDRRYVFGLGLGF
jgi:hypothetical protein